ncbi:MAG: YlbF family regulator [Bacillota bacterium]
MIKEKARELAAAIKETEEFKGLQSARARVKLDPTAFDLLTKLQQTQARIIGLQQQGQPITQEIVEELRTLEEQMQLNLTLRNMVEAQQKFEDMMDEVNQVLAENLG